LRIGSNFEVMLDLKLESLLWLGTIIRLESNFELRFNLEVRTKFEVKINFGSNNLESVFRLGTIF
jgi:hypothetical protein